MPYSGITDAGLPTSVKKLPKALRELWVRVFNESYDAGKPEDCFHLVCGIGPVAPAV